MQIDGHHAATYVAARAAGFNHSEAATIAYAAQYVDDATNAGPILFENSEYMYARIASAHGMIDYQNVIDVANHLAWIPFHFLPGNGGLPAGKEPPGGEPAKLICTPDSPVARDMLLATLADRDSPRALHRLGIAMHVYADTFAHQGFMGAINPANYIADVKSSDSRYDARIKGATIKSMILGLLSKSKAGIVLFLASLVQSWKERKWPTRFWKDFMGEAPLGHAAADTFPDQPYLIWTYLDWLGRRIDRRNPVIFLEAVDMMTRALRAWRSGTTCMDLTKYAGLGPVDAQVVNRLFRDIDEPEGERRHLRWLDAIAAGEFSFGSATLNYVGKGVGSWKHQALGTVKRKDTGYERYEYSPAFLLSDWKLFHDALQAHRSDVVHNILPRYGVCAA